MCLLQRGHSGDRFDLASTLCKYDLRQGDLFVLSWARVCHVSSCRCCMFVFCVHRVAVFNAAFCMTCSLLMLVEDARGDHMEEIYSRASLILYH